MEKKIYRRDFIKKSAITAGALSTGAFALSHIGCKKDFSNDSDRPNIIFITADDMGWKTPSCYGNRQIETKSIDRIAREGALFRQAFVVTSSCSPSRASFITGQYPHTNGVTGLTHRRKRLSLSPFHRTLPELLQKAGYNTAIQGKWHVSPYLPTSWYGYNERLSGMLPKDWHIKSPDKAIEFIKRNRDNRFYLELNFLQNHRDDFGEFHFADGFPVDPKKTMVPEHWALPQWPEIKEDTAKYYSQTLQMDSIIGDILDVLDELGLTENTMVMFVSDNGAPFPGSKMTLYDRGTGTPLVVRWPQKVMAGMTLDMLTSTIDIMPTMLEAAGADIPGDTEGISFLPQLTGKSGRPNREALFMEMTYHVHYLPTRAARTDRWKYIRNYSDIARGLDEMNHMKWAHRLCELPDQPWKSPRVPEELYDLETDPNEQNNLVDNPEYGDVKERMSAMLGRHMKETDDPFLGKEFTRDYSPELYKRTEKKKQ